MSVVSKRVRYVRAERVFPDVGWGDARSVRTPWWRKLWSGLLLGVLVGLLGLVLTAAVGATIVLLFLILDQLVG